MTERWLDEFAARRPRSRALYEEIRQRVAGGVGHDLRHSPVAPLYIERARGARKWDVDGNEYLDFSMGNAALLLGHAHPAVVAAVREALDQGTHFGNDHRSMLEWARLIHELMPSCERIRFVNSGTEGTMLALRLARAFTGRTQLLRFEGHFSGWHDYVGKGVTPPFDAPYSIGIPQAILDTIMVVPADLNVVEDTLRRHHDVAAIMLEPSGGSWGTVPLTVPFNRELRALATRYEVPLIYDEVITGFRYSPGGYQRLAGVPADLTVLGKVMAGGLPGGAVGGRLDLMRQFEYTGDVRHDRHARVAHQGTFNANPLSAAAGIATLRLAADGKVQAHADRMAEALRRGMEAALDEIGAAAFVYGDSSVFHVYMEAYPGSGRKSREEIRTSDPTTLKGIPPRVVTAFQKNLQIRGVDLLSYTGGVTSAAHTEADVQQAVAVFREAMRALLDEQLVARL
ncbi:MAG TPA: aminotransferase class III-fold pyridoxal phosphate-dependent enzyme [bacterium]|nr:aminotransferase class III-fold pyridoxal phosphate-dependent enzyme [bacterium]